MNTASQLATESVSLTEESLKLFLLYANDAGNWNGNPLVGGNITHTQKDNGNLTDLKKKGLLTTFRSDGYDWIEFTAAGIAFAALHGIEI